MIGDEAAYDTWPVTLGLCGPTNSDRLHMNDNANAFIRLALEREVLRFGRFTLKSGRVSPYFFNLGAISSGAGLAQLGRMYADALLDADTDFDRLFGPAYKGIPLAAATAVALSNHGLDIPYAYNRKEKKDHGEGGSLVGAPIAGRVVIIDDVITAGTAVREAVSIIQQAGGEVAAVAIALDRQERGAGDCSTLQELEKEGIPAISLATLDDVVTYLTEQGGAEETLAAIADYRDQYGA